jgi:hypothetical protein
MTDLHPITPPLELVQQWWTDAQTLESNDSQEIRFIANVAARWGADQELEACCEWLAFETPEPYINALRAARRPKLPTLKEQALEALGADGYSMLAGKRLEPVQLKLIRRALEALPND